MGLVMKSFKVPITSILLSFFTLGTVYTQTAPKLALALHTGLSGSGATIGFGLRSGLGNHFALNASVGRLPLKLEGSSARVVDPTVQLYRNKIKGLEAYSIGLMGFSKKNQAGFYGGISFGLQRFQFESRVLARSQTSSLSHQDGIPANDFGDFFWAMFGIPPAPDKGNIYQDVTSFKYLNLLAINAGYAFLFHNNSRLEIGLNRITRSQANHHQIGIEFRYVKPLF